jgi:hypothetical protein
MNGSARGASLSLLYRFTICIRWMIYVDIHLPGICDMATKTSRVLRTRVWSLNFFVFYEMVFSHATRPAAKLLSRIDIE